MNVRNIFFTLTWDPLPYEAIVNNVKVSHLESLPLSYQNQSYMSWKKVSWFSTLFSFTSFPCESIDVKVGGYVADTQISLVFPLLHVNEKVLPILCSLKEQTPSSPVICTQVVHMRMAKNRVGWGNLLPGFMPSTLLVTVSQDLISHAKLRSNPHKEEMLNRTGKRSRLPSTL